MTSTGKTWKDIIERMSYMTNEDVQKRYGPGVTFREAIILRVLSDLADKNIPLNAKLLEVIMNRNDGKPVEQKVIAHLDARQQLLEAGYQNPDLIIDSVAKLLGKSNADSLDSQGSAEQTEVTNASQGTTDDFSQQ